MKLKKLILGILFVVCCVVAFGQSEGKKVEEEFGRIRANMARNACDLVEFKNQSVIDKIKNENLNDFVSELKKINNDTIAKKLLKIIEKAQKIDGKNIQLNQIKDKGKYKDRLDENKKNIETIWEQLKKAYEDEGIEPNCDFQQDIDSLYDECFCYYSNDNKYWEKYKYGIFKDFMPEDVKKQIFENCKTLQEIKEFENNFPDKSFDFEGKYFEICIQSYNIDDLNDYLSKFGENAKHGAEVKRIIDSINNAKGDTIKVEYKNTSGLTEQKKSGSWYIYITIAVVSLLVGFFLGKVKGARPQPEYSTEQAPESGETAISEQEESPAPEQEETPVAEETSTAEETPVAEEVVLPSLTTEADWVVVGASVKGNGHIEAEMPCQDNNKFVSWGNGWGIAVVSDGAGSAEHSEVGSKAVVERSVKHFETLVEKEGWIKNKTLPTDAEWLQKSYNVLKIVRDEIELIAKNNNVSIKSLSATCLVVIYSPFGLLTVHVGDGRMGYKSMSGEWKAIMTPHKGEEANQTIFLVSEFWDIRNYVLSGVLVPESVVVREPVLAFTLMSDGCENTSWRCTGLNPETGKYYDQNKPFEAFFNPLEETLHSFHTDNITEEERYKKWYQFIESGTKGFVKEQDDKTMVLGVRI